MIDLGKCPHGADWRTCGDCSIGAVMEAMTRQVMDRIGTSLPLDGDRRNQSEQASRLLHEEECYALYRYLPSGWARESPALMSMTQAIESAEVLLREGYDVAVTTWTPVQLMAYAPDGGTMFVKSKRR